MAILSSFFRSEILVDPCICLNLFQIGEIDVIEIIQCFYWDEIIQLIMNKKLFSWLYSVP